MDNKIEYNRLMIVPARGGSKRLPGKNARLLKGKPLFQHTIDVVKDHFTKVIFTTDDLEILSQAEKLNKDNDNVSCVKRPDQLATDTSKVLDIVKYYFKQNREYFDQIWLALPTCPLRTSEDVKNCIDLLTKDIDGIISVCEYNFPPMLALTKNDEGIIKDWHSEEPWQKENSRSQDHQTLYRPNGAIYGMWADFFERKKNFYKGNIKGYLMPIERSIDIDTEFDFRIAEMVINGIDNR